MKRRSVLTVLLSFFLLIAFTLSASAARPSKPILPMEYVSIGDSIAYGMSALPGNDYYTKFAAFLAQNAQVSGVSFTSTNTAWLGLTSTQLDDEIAGRTVVTPTRAGLPGATIVTISIGGNNLMHPLIDYVADLYGVSTDNSDFMNVLTLAVNADPVKLSNAMFWQIAIPGSALRTALAQGVADFRADLPTILSGIKTLSSTPKIYFLTVNNPLYGNAQLRGFIDTYIIQINNELKARASTLGYTVVEVYAKFNAYTGSEPLVGFNMAAVPATYDPHPTTAGHRLIYELLVSAYTYIPVKGRK